MGKESSISLNRSWTLAGLSLAFVAVNLACSAYKSSDREFFEANARAGAPTRAPSPTATFTPLPTPTPTPSASPMPFSKVDDELASAHDDRGGDHDGAIDTSESWPSPESIAEPSIR